MFVRRAFPRVAAAGLAMAACSSGFSAGSTSPTSASPSSSVTPATTVAPVTGVTVRALGGTPSTGEVATHGPSWTFANGQAADMALSGCGLDTACGALDFNHPGQIATDGTHLALADTRNQRVLLWNSIPTTNTPPDLVLGQPSFTSGSAGTALSSLNAPIGVAFAGSRFVVTDSGNNRILVWNAVPVASGQPADYAITNHGNSDVLRTPWGVWSDGNRLLVAGRTIGAVLVWNTFPTSDRPPDFLLDGLGALGTPRYVASDGTHLIVGDYQNSYDRTATNFFWDSMPTADRAPDFATSDSLDPSGGWGRPAPMTATFTSGGSVVGFNGNRINIWNDVPAGDRTADVVIGHEDGRHGEVSFGGGSGVGDGIAVAGGRVFISIMNTNHVAVYDTIPTGRDQAPDWFLGGGTSLMDDPQANLGRLSNPSPASDGTSLWVKSNFSSMAVWSRIPQTDGAIPDYVYNFDRGGSELLAIAVADDTLVVGGGSQVYVWSPVPRHGELPNQLLDGSIGSITVAPGRRDEEIVGLALSANGFYVAVAGPDQIYFWRGGIPTPGAEPDATVSAPGVRSIHADGTYLTLTFDSRSPASPDVPVPPVAVYREADFADGATPWFSTNGGAPFNTGPAFSDSATGAITADGRLVVADTGLSRVLIWNDINTAAAGGTADVVLGSDSMFMGVGPQPLRPGAQRLINPGFVCWDGSYLWVGEFKFSDRLLRYTPAG